MTTRQTLKLLRDYESRNITFLDSDGSWPIVWERARGVHIWDAEGRKYLDLTAAFGVAAAGHANPRVVRAGQKQMARLLHAMGDVHPHLLKAQLARELSALTFERWTAQKSILLRQKHYGGREIQSPKSKVVRHWGKTILANSGFEAVEAALKTAALATGKSGIIAFTGAYHGLGYGALNATHREHFRGPFLGQLREFGSFVPFPTRGEEMASVSKRITALLSKRKIGAILVEPIQVRGGVNIPPPGFLPALRKICDHFGALLILDEIYTGFGRTGKWFACEHSSTIPDLICLGKALTGGFPLSACIGRADIMDAAWPLSEGEAIHTSTFLGHPVGCAMALAEIQEIKRLDLVRRSAVRGDLLLRLLKSEISNSKFEMQIRGAGLLVGLELRLRRGGPAFSATLDVVKMMLKKGYILLPEGEYSNVIGFTPPLIINQSELTRVVDALSECIASV